MISAPTIGTLDGLGTLEGIGTLDELLAELRAHEVHRARIAQAAARLAAGGE